MSILFKNAQIIATENGQFKVLNNAYLGVEGDKIDYIGTEKPKKEYSEVKDFSNKMIFPGLVNSHGHTAMTLLRGLGSDLPLMDWLGIMWPIEDIMRKEEMVSGMELAIMEMLSCGTTSFCDMYMMPHFTQKVIEDTGIKADLCQVFMGGDDNTDYKNYDRRLKALDLYKNYNGAFNDRLHIDWCVHGEYTIHPVVAQKWADEISSIGGRLHIHMSETKSEHEKCIEKYGKSPAQWFASLGFFKIPTYAAHCVWCTEEDMDIMKAWDVSPVHNPTSNLKLGSGFAPVPKMLEKGLNVCLGTDGAASNNNLNMFEEMHLSAILHNGNAQDPTIMKPSEVLSMATINGAKLQGRMDTGSLEVGKKADIAAINLDSPHLIPNIDPLALLVYSAQGSDVCMTMVDGKILYENGEFKTLDREAVLSRVKSSLNYLYKK